jgi:16S rRNA (guanine527-N7)-methyltransferase
MSLASEDEARAFCADLTDSAGLERLDRLEKMVLTENARQNLIAKGSEGLIWQRHLADSAQLVRLVSRGGATEQSEQPSSPWLDLGTGAGFPGLVVAAIRPEWQVILVESRRKRFDWLTEAAAALGLHRCRIEGKRLEHVGSFAAGVISARAFAPLHKLLALSARFSTQDTLWLLPKGRSAMQELASLPPPSARLFHVEQSATDDEAGIVTGKGRPPGIGPISQ